MFHLFASLKSLFASNQFLLGGTILGMIAAILAYAKSVPLTIITWIKNRIFVTVFIDSRSGCYEWLEDWLGEYDERKFRFVLPKIKWIEETGGIKRRYIPQVSFAPAPGDYIIKFQGRHLWISVRKDDEKVGDIVLGERKEIYITKFGRDKTIFHDLFRAGHDITYSEELSSKVNVFNADKGIWTKVDEKKPRRRETLIFDDGVLDRIINDAKRFLGRRAWYESMCIPFRRGYLFYGEPGNGKSSLALLLASELQAHICVLNVSSIASDNELLSSIANMPKGCLLLLEDIDASSIRREKKEEGKTMGVTFSGLLNALDGLLASDGRILVMTTNHKDHLDPALIRSGRADVHEYIGNANRSQIAKMFSRFYEDTTVEQQDAFSTILPERTLSMAKLQEFLMAHGSAESAIANAVVLTTPQPAAPERPTETPNEAVVAPKAETAASEKKEEDEELIDVVESSPNPKIVNAHFSAIAV